MGLLVLNAARDNVMPAIGGPGAQDSHFFFIASGYVCTFCFIAIFSRLQKISWKLLRLGGCKSDAYILSDMKKALLRLNTSDQLREQAKSLEQIKHELREWEEANSVAAKNAAKKAMKRAQDTNSEKKDSSSPLRQTAQSLKVTKQSPTLTELGDGEDAGNGGKAEGAGNSGSGTADEPEPRSARSLGPGSSGRGASGQSTLQGTFDEAAKEHNDHETRQQQTRIVHEVRF
jgi:hypothetical protein